MSVPTVIANAWRRTIATTVAGCLILAPGQVTLASAQPVPPTPAAATPPSPPAPTEDQYPAPPPQGSQPPDPVGQPAQGPVAPASPEDAQLRPLPPPHAAGGVTDSDQGLADGTADAEADTNTVLWFGAGCVLSLVGVLIGYVVEPSPPPSRYVGRSPEYVAAFSSAYRSAGSSAQGRSAIFGCLTLIVLEGAFILAAANSGL
jgi:hypothetical protein